MFIHGALLFDNRAYCLIKYQFSVVAQGSTVACIDVTYPPSAIKIVLDTIPSRKNMLGSLCVAATIVTSSLESRFTG